MDILLNAHSLGHSCHLPCGEDHPDSGLPGSVAPGSPRSRQLPHSRASSANWTRARPPGRVKCSWWREAQISDELHTMEPHRHMTITKAHAGCSFFAQKCMNYLKLLLPLHRSPSPSSPSLQIFHAFLRVKFSQGTTGQMLSGVTSFFAKWGPNTTQKLAFSALLLTAWIPNGALAEQTGAPLRLLSEPGIGGDSQLNLDFHRG